MDAADTFRRILVLCRKELLSALKDRRSRIVLIVPAILQTLVFGYAATYDINDVPYAVFDEDHSAASRTLIARLEGSGVFRRVRSLDSPREIAPTIDGKDALLVVHIGQNFQRQLESGSTAPLQLLLDSRNANTAGTAARYVDTIVATFNTNWRIAHGFSAPAITVESRSWYNPDLETRWSMITGLIAALSLLQTLLFTALSVAREREQGTFDQLLVTPLRPAEIMAGKAVPSIFIGLAQVTVILLVSLLWFRIPLAGSVLTLYAGLMVFIVASVGIGLAISALSLNMQQAMLNTFVLLIPMMLLSGLTSPIANMPRAMRYVTVIDPLRYAVEFVRRVYLEGVGLTWVTDDLWPLALIAALTLSAATWLFRNRLS
jgi:pyoluteorin transport system permease protein